MNSYPKVYNVGHPALDGFFSSAKIQVEEKVDGSQLSFGVFDGELCARSKGKEIPVDAPEKMFAAGIGTARDIQHLLTPGWAYRCEYLQKPKHNALAYDRRPERYVVLFDINTEPERYISRAELEHEADRLDLDIVPILYEGQISTVEDVKKLLETKSFLGGQLVEGLVFKRRGNPLWGRDGKPLIAKHVSEAFKETHKREWTRNNPKRDDIVAMLIHQYRTEARWHKAVQHMRDNGQLENEPRDIGQLIKEVQADIKDECVDEIKESLFKHFGPHILRGAIRGLPEWYKERLLKRGITQ